MSKFIIFCVLLSVYSLLVIYQCATANKYSAAAPKDTKSHKNGKKVTATAGKEIPLPNSIRELDKPYRMAKLNLLWTKAKHRLTGPKLQSLFSDLKLHDKEELAHKHHQADENDEDGLEEARLRKKVIGIMSTYGLLDHFAATDDSELVKQHKAINDGSNYAAKEVFQDKRLNHLWSKAEKAGFTHEELMALKEEFTHHQEKVDEYMSILKDLDGGNSEAYKNSINVEHESWNEIDPKEDESTSTLTKEVDYISKAKILRDKHLGMKSELDDLERQTMQGKNHQEFVEPKVQGLWRIAKQAQFTTDELASLKEELHHYETRLLKLRHLHTEAALDAVRHGKDYDADNSTKHNIKKHARIVEKLHADIESRILERHTEF